MSGVTITAGWSFSGGITITEAPPPAPENTAAWLAGGFNYAIGGNQSSVDRITFATDTATSSARGPLSAATASPAAASNTTYGWWGGGGYGLNMSRVQRITFATDTATASVRGPLSSGRSGCSAAGNTTDGWFGGVTPGPLSTVDRITYATDTATASVRGPLSSGRGALIAAGNTTDGWFGGGSIGAPPAPQSTVDRITYATDTATASVRGPLSSVRSSFGATGNTTDGWFGGGNTSTGGQNPVSRVDRITYATDTVTASVRGPLSLARFAVQAAGNTTNGWWGGGYYFSTVDRVTYATDTATASARGPLSVVRYYSAAAGGIQ